MTNHKDVRLQDWGEEIDYNLFPDGKALKKARENGTDKHSTYGNPLFKNPEAGDFSVEKNSPSLKLGFVNFPMDNFGVQKPELKTIAKRPKIPVLYISEFQKIKVKTRLWLGAVIKTVETLGERSAAGLDKVAGVLILKIERGNLADQAGLQEGDVIIKCENIVIERMGDLLNAHQGANWMGRLKLVVFRNQEENEVIIRTK